jgi:hypothetical protein
VVQWSNVQVIFKGENVEENRVSLQESCVSSSGSSKELILFPTQVTFESAIGICHQLGGEIPLPRSELDLAWTSTPKNTVTMNTTCGEGVWMPIVRSKSNASKWISAKDPARDVQVDYLPWEWSQPNGFPIQNCVYATSKEGQVSYWDALCDFLYCFPCKLSDNRVFNLRGPSVGLPNVDKKYLFIQDHAERGVYNFQGFKGQSNIVYNSASKVWEIVSMVDGKSVLGTFYSKEKFPIGVHEWSMKDETGKMFSKLKLTKVII